MNLMMPRMKSFGGRFVWPVVLLLALAACGTEPPAADYRDNHPLVAGVEVVSMSIDVPFGKNRLTDEERAGIRNFANDYINRGKGQMVVETGAGEGGGDAIPDKLLKMRSELVSAGVRYSEIRLKPGGSAPKDSIVFSFPANTVDVPECGDWASDATHNWSNRRQSNFGCSMQRNIGLMLANPGDINKARDLSPRDPNDVTRVITGQRGGAATGAAHSAIAGQ